MAAGIQKPFWFRFNLKAEHEKSEKKLIARKVRELTSATAKEKKTNKKTFNPF